jgi:hypothetical protein
MFQWPVSGPGSGNSLHSKKLTAAVWCTVEQLEARLCMDATSIASGNWNDTSTWLNGLVPVAGDRVTVATGHTVTYNDTTPDDISYLTIDGKLTFGSSQTLELRSTGNILVNGELEMRPTNTTYKHIVTFVGVNEANFVGSNGPAGGMVVLDSDVGLWVVDNGILDAIGTTKKSWTRLSGAATAGQTSITVEDATGWRVGDMLAIAPTLPPNVTNAWNTYDERTITAVSGNTITLNSALTYDHPVVNGMWKAEVMNLTRNVLIRGQAPDGSGNHRAHVQFMHNANAQTVKYVEFRYLGPKQGTSFTGVVGRYAVHFHHNEDGSRGSLLEGLSAHDIGNHVYVTHASHGIYLKETISHNTYDDAYWWDSGLAHQSHDITYDTIIASRVLGGGSTETRVANVELGGGNGNKMFNSVAVGSAAVYVQSAGIEWAETSGSSVWDFHDNIVHNNRLHGIFVWQNVFSAPHLVEKTAIYHNSEQGLVHGAYVNVYVYDQLHFYGNRTNNMMIQASSFNDGVITPPLTVSNSIFDGAGISTNGISVGRHPSHTSLGGPTYIENNTFKGFSAAGKYAFRFSWDQGAQHPGDGTNDGWNDVPYPGNSDSHREWYRLTNNDFSQVTPSQSIYANGVVTGGVPMGIAADSDILVTEKEGGVYNLRSYHFTPTITYDFNRPTYDPSIWRWFMIASAVDGSLVNPTLLNGEGLMSSRNGTAASRMFTIKQYQAVSVDQTVQARLDHNQALAGLVARKSKTDEGTYYKATVGNAGGVNNLTIWKVVDGVATSLGSVALTMTNGVNYKLRFQLQQNGAGTDLRAKLWDASTAEPGSWSLQVLGNTEARLQKVWGDYGIIGTAAGANPTVFDNYSGTILDTITFDAAKNANIQTFVATGTPIVDTGRNQNVRMVTGGDSVLIDATVKDNGVTNPTSGMTYTWTKVTGPGTVVFNQGAAIDTAATFSTAGSYVLRLTASDSTNVGYDDVKVYVGPSGVTSFTETWTGTAGAAWPAGWSQYQVSGHSSLAQIITGNRGQIGNPVAGQSESIMTNSGLLAENVDTTSTIALGSNATGGLVVRQSPANAGTFLALRVRQAYTQMFMVVDGVVTELSPQAVFNPQLGINVDQRVRFQVITNADGSIDMRAKVWAATTTEPTGWTLEFLGWNSKQSQRFVGRAGKTGVLANQYTGSTGTNAVKFDDYTVTSLDPVAVSAGGSFTSNFTGTSGGWGSNWSHTGPWPTIDLNNNTGRIMSAAATQTGLAYYNQSSFVNSTQTFKFNSTLNGPIVGLIARADPTTNTYYRVRTGTMGTSGSTANDLYIDKVINGVATNIATLTFLPALVAQNIWWHMTFDVQQVGGSTQLSAKVWQDGTTEPTGWHLTTTDSTAALQNAAGRAGMYISLTSGRTLYVDDYELEWD